MKFVSLHNHTNYSILDALSSPKDLFSRAKELEQPSVAITDHGTFAANWDALKASRETGVKFIVGCEYYFADNSKVFENKIRNVVLLAKNAVGYSNLLKLNREGFDHGFNLKKSMSIIDWDLLDKYREGVICLTGSGTGIIGKLISEKKQDIAEKQLKRLEEIFGKDNLGVEVQSHNVIRSSTYFSSPVNQAFTNYQAIKIAKKLGYKVVPTCNSHYLHKDLYPVHDILLSVGSMQPHYSNSRVKYDVPDLYLKSYEEVKSFFSRNYGESYAEEICENTLYFDSLCEKPDWIEPKFSNPTGKELPVFDVASASDIDKFESWKADNKKYSHLKPDEMYLRYRCYTSLNELILSSKIDLSKIDKYKGQLEEELDVLEFQGFSSYMLIVADFVDWCRDNNIPVGCGRGSVGGSLVAHLLKIHAADPIKYNLIFARFQNRERTSPPDIDQDVSTRHRGKVIDYIYKKYGQDYVASISNFNTITPKVYVRDVCRSAELGGSRKAAVELGNRIADLIPKDVNSWATLSKQPLFLEYCKKYHQLADNSPILGLKRNLSTHAAAIVISKRPLVGLVPLRKDKDGNVAIEYEKDTVEANGLLKMDILGLSTLDLIEDIIVLINKHGKELPKEHLNYAFYDKKTYDLISSGDTFGVFQLGTSAGTIDLCKKIKPKSIEDLAIITTLARPAAKDIREDFISAKNSGKKAKLLHPSLENAFGNTYGFGLYDESILKLASDVAGWSLHSADRLRKMIKSKGKDPEKDKKLREEFINDAANRIGDKNLAQRIWDEEVGKFQGYTFNLAHATTYSFLSYTTAYLKAHYPVEFLLANLAAELSSNTPDAPRNVDKIKKELKASGVDILPPSINNSDTTYKIIDGNKLLTGFNGIKYVGDDAIIDIIAHRPFSSFYEFMVKVSSSAVRSTAIQALAATGCLDSFGFSRRALFLNCSDYRKKLQVWLKKHDPEKDTFEYKWKFEKEWTKPELFALEKYYLGESFICGKSDAFPGFFGSNHFPIKKISQQKNKAFISSVKGEIKDIIFLKVKKETSKYYGQEMVKVLIEDEANYQTTATIFPDRWKDIKSALSKKGRELEIGGALNFSATCNLYENEMSFIMEECIQYLSPPHLPKDMKKEFAQEDGHVISDGGDLATSIEKEMMEDIFPDIVDAD